MKIKLVAHKDVPVLVISEDLPAEKIPVLKAGLKKLLCTGKDRIILELSGVQSLAPQAIIEVGRFHELAKELSGKIILVSRSPEVVRVIAEAHVSSLMPVLMSLDEAVDVLLQSTKAQAEEDIDGMRLLKEREKQVRDEIAKMGANNQALEAKLKGMSDAEIKKLRYEKREFARRIKILESQLEKFPRARKSAPLKPEFEAKLRALEEAALGMLKSQGIE